MTYVIYEASSLYSIQPPHHFILFFSFYFLTYPNPSHAKKTFQGIFITIINPPNLLTLKLKDV